MFCQGLRLVDGDEGSAVVDPHQLGVLEVFGKSFGVGGGHELVVSCPDDEDRAGEGALLVGPLEQLLGIWNSAEVLGEVAADLGVVAQRTDPAPEQVVGNPPLGQGPKVTGRWRIQRGRNSWAVRKVPPGSAALRHSSQPGTPGG